MAKSCRGIRLRKAQTVLIVTALWLSSCAGGESGISSEEALALSASALSGTDNFVFAGEVSIFDPSGVLAGTAEYSGKVSGHGDLELQWRQGNVAAQSFTDEGPPAFHPLQLLTMIQNRDARISYADASGKEGSVLLRIELPPEAASAMIAEGLRGELAKLKEEVRGRILSPEESKEAGRLLADAEEEMEAALSSLKAQSVYYWEADRKSWFPRTLTEQTTIKYIWKDKPFSENRTSVTHFITEGRNDTMKGNSSLKTKQGG